jgi:hypothetical protein
MVSMISRNPDSTGTESTDPDIRMAYRSITQHGSLDWSVLISPPQLLLPTHIISNRLVISYGKVGHLIPPKTAGPLLTIQRGLFSCSGLLG